MTISYHDSAYTKPQHAFTLVELSIVIVVISLIVAGITAAKSLVRAAQINSAITTVQSVQSAMMQFKYQYQAMPGDITNASNYWPGSPVGNGNGNWETWSWTNNAENFAAWYHLQKAQLIGGSYTGVQGSGCTAGVNVPKLATGAKDAIVLYYGNNSGTYSAQNALQIVKEQADYAIPVTEAYNIDVKFDDGKPYTGRIISFGCFALWMGVDGNSAAARAAKAYEFSQANLSTGLCNMQFAVYNTFFK